MTVAPNDPTDPPARQEPRLSREYGEVVGHWKEQATTHAARVAELEREVAAAKASNEASSAASKADGDSRVAAAEKAASVRLIRAELKALAVKEGITDAADLALLDVSKAKLTEDGEVEGAAEIVAAFKKAKPHLFGGKSSSHTGTTPPAAAGATDKRARDMTDAEYKAARAAAIRA